MRGRDRVLHLISEASFQALALPDTTIMSASCDMGMTYGLFQTFEGSNINESWSQYSYLRIWKKETGNLWRIVLDLALPVSTGIEPPPDLRDRLISTQLRVE